MIKHVILWPFKDELTAAEKADLGAQIKKGLEDLKGVVPGLTDIHVCVSPLPSSNADILLDSTVTDFYDFTKNSFTVENYQFHPFDFEIPMAI